MVRYRLSLAINNSSPSRKGLLDLRINKKERERERKISFPPHVFTLIDTRSFRTWSLHLLILSHPHFQAYVIPGGGLNESTHW